MEHVGLLFNSDFADGLTAQTTHKALSVVNEKRPHGVDPFLYFLTTGGHVVLSFQTSV